MDSSLTSFQQFAALRGFQHFAVHAVSTTSFQLVWQQPATRVLVDVPADALVRVRLLEAPHTELQLRRASPHRVVREIAALMQRDVPGFVQPSNLFAVDFTLLLGALVPLSSPLERALLAGALVHFLQPLVAADAADAVCDDVARLVELHAVELQDAAIGRRVSLDSFQPL